MSSAPESAVSPVAQTPPNSATLGLRQLLNQVMAVIFGDNVMDQDEMAALREFFDEVQMRAQAAGGIGQGGTPSPEGPQPTPDAAALNQNTQEQYSNQPGVEYGDQGS